MGNENDSVRFTGRVQVQLPTSYDSFSLAGAEFTQNLWKLVGAFDDSTLKVKYLSKYSVYLGGQDYSAECLEVKCSSPLLEAPMVRRLMNVQEASGSRFAVIENVNFRLRAEWQKKGIGTASFAMQVVSAKQAGFKRIFANAAGNAESSYVGYKVWPKLGYDAVVDDDIRGRMPAEALVNAGLDPNDRSLRISDLLKRDVYPLWEEHGEGGVMEFSLDENSWSLNRLKYISLSTGKEQK